MRFPLQGAAFGFKDGDLSCSQHQDQAQEEITEDRFHIYKVILCKMTSTNVQVLQSESQQQQKKQPKTRFMF